MHLATALELAAHRYPETDAVVDHPLRLSYGHWNRRINGVAHGLRRVGIKDGDPVAICALNREATATTYFAVLKAGGTAVWLNARWKRMELAHALDEAGVKAIVFDQTTRPEVEQALIPMRQKSLRITIGQTFAGPASPQQVPAVTNDGLAVTRSPEILSFTELAAHPRDKPPTISRDPDQISTILYTSGTTGRPKGVVRSHKSDYHAAIAMIVEHRWTRFERTLGVMPLYHTMGLHTLISLALLNGTCILFPKFNPGACLQTLETEKITALYLVPTAFHDLVQHAALLRTQPASVPKLACAGAPMHPDLVERCQAAFRPKIFVNHYGCTEMHVISVNADLASLPDSAGRPALHSRIRIVAADRNRRVMPDETLPAGATGEVIVDAASPQAFAGYLHRPEATQAVLRSGWYFTGDLGRRDASGNLFLRGRVDDMIISGGENINPLEVEQVLLQHPHVRDAAVAGISDARWGEVVTAFVVPAGPGLTRDSLEEYCRNSPLLARFKRPRRFVFVTAIPRSPAGKILRAHLRTGHDDHPLTSV